MIFASLAHYTVVRILSPDITLHSILPSCNREITLAVSTFNEFLSTKRPRNYKSVSITSLFTSTLDIYLYPNAITRNPLFVKSFNIDVNADVFILVLSHIDNIISGDPFTIPYTVLATLSYITQLIRYKELSNSHSFITVNVSSFFLTLNL